MKKPTSIENIQLIAVLRVLQCSHDTIAAIIHVHKTTIAGTEEWFQNEDIDIVYDIIDDQALKTTVVRELTASEEIDNMLLAKAVQVTRDAILGHYGRIQKSKDTNACLHIGAPSVDVYRDSICAARYASVEVTAANLEAKDCWAWVDIIPSGPSFPLHWAGTPYTSEETTAARIMIRHEKPARLDVAVAIPPLGRAAAALFPDALISGEVAMFLPTAQSVEHIWNGEGCWLAQPLALDTPDPRLEAYLTLGDYRIKIRVGCDNGEGDGKEFILHSPSSWEDLALISV